MRPLACVLGEIDLVRALGVAGIDSAPVARPGDLTRYSRYARTVVDWVDPWLEPEKLVSRLLAFAETQDRAPILFYDADWDLLVVSRHRRQLQQAFRFVVPEATLVEQLVDKSRFQELAERVGLPVPRGRTVAAGERPHGAELGLRFPLVAKPLTRQHATWRPVVAAKAMRVQTPTELQALWPRVADAGVDVLLQELVEGPESRIESYHVYRDANGEIVASFTGRKLRTHPAEYGYTTALVIDDLADVDELGQELVRKLDLRGVAKFDFKRDDDGSLHLLEINPRFNLWHYPGAKAGVNLAELVYLDLVGAERPPVPRPRPGVRWCSLAHDWQAARRDGIPILRWLPWALSCDTTTPFAWRDPAPAFRTIFWRLGRQAGRFGNAVRRRRSRLGRPGA